MSFEIERQLVPRASRALQLKVDTLIHRSPLLYTSKGTEKPELPAAREDTAADSSPDDTRGGGAVGKIVRVKNE